MYFILGAGIATGYGLGGREVGVRAPVGALISFHAIQTGSEAQPTFCPVDNQGSFLMDKAAGVWS
jgi:hypothetical protein